MPVAEGHRSSLDSGRSLATFDDGGARFSVAPLAVVAAGIVVWILVAPWGWSQLWAGAALACGAGLAFRRRVTSTLVVTDSGLRHRTAETELFVAWEEIDRLERHGRFLRPTTAFVVTTAGDKIRLDALRNLPRIVDEIDRQLDRRRKFRNIAIAWCAPARNPLLPAGWLKRIVGSFGLVTFVLVLIGCPGPWKRYPLKELSDFADRLNRTNVLCSVSGPPIADASVNLVIGRVEVRQIAIHIKLSDLERDMLAGNPPRVMASCA